MIGAQQVVDIALAAADPGAETVVLVTDRADASPAVGRKLHDHQR